MNIIKSYLCEFELLLKKQQIAPLNGTICYSDDPIHSLQKLQSYNERCKVQKQKMRCKNRPWDLLIHLHIVRRNSACVCKAVQATRHTLFHQLNHNKVLNKKYNIYFFKNQYNILLGNFLSMCARDFYKVAPQTSQNVPRFLGVNCKCSYCKYAFFQYTKQTKYF